MSNHIKGIDISRWQGTNINWTNVKRDGYRFAFMKLTDGHAYKSAFIDGARLQANGALNAGLKIGYYHYSQPTTSQTLELDARKEASFFLNTLANNFPSPNFPLVLDFEDTPNSLTKSENEAWINTFTQKLANASHDSILYSYRYYFNQNLNINHNLGQHSLWHAYYPNVFNPNASLILPKGFIDWKIWQYTKKGRVNGFGNQDIDLNIMKKSFFDQY
jgi:lysozyme